MSNPPSKIAESDADRTAIVPGMLVLNRYVAGEPFGFGGTAMVWRGHTRDTQQPVALKIPHRRKRTPTHNEERLRREAQLLKRIQSPYVMGIHDFGHLSDGRPVAVFEYMEGSTLRTLLREHDTLDPTDALMLIRELMLGLRDVHACGVVHRDIKPDNIMIERFEPGREVRVKLFDFGIAKLLSEQLNGVTQQTDPEVAELFTPLTAAEMTVGTPEYMAPEQISASDLGGFTDIYAAGIVLHEILFGVVPYTGKTFFEIAHRHLEGILPPLPAHLPQSLQELIWRALACDIYHRYSNAEAMIGDIDKALDALASGITSTPQPQTDPIHDDEQAPWAVATTQPKPPPEMVQAVAYGSLGSNPDHASPPYTPQAEPDSPPWAVLDRLEVDTVHKSTQVHWMPWAVAWDDPWHASVKRSWNAAHNSPPAPTPPRSRPRRPQAVELDTILEAIEHQIAGADEFPNDGIHDISSGEEFESDGIHDISIDDHQLG
ncbi:MAG: protein kinase [Myxococcota bacterium]